MVFCPATFLMQLTKEEILIITFILEPDIEIKLNINVDNTLKLDNYIFGDPVFENIVIFYLGIAIIK